MFGSPIVFSAATPLKAASASEKAPVETAAGEHCLCTVEALGFSELNLMQTYPRAGMAAQEAPLLPAGRAPAAECPWRAAMFGWGTPLTRATPLPEAVQPIT